MNAKTCKRLRRMAEATTIGKPYRAYRETTQGKVYQYGTDTTTGYPLYAKKNNTLELTNCTRDAYQAMKREAARA